MDFQLSDEQVLLRDTTRDLLSRSYDAESRNKAIASDLGWSKEVWTQLAEIGILGLGFDPDEAGQLEVITVLTEVGRRLAPEPVVHAALGPGRDHRRGRQRRPEATARRGRRRSAAAGVCPPRARRTRGLHREGLDNGCATR